VPILSAKSLILSFGGIGSFISAIVISLAVSLTLAFADERRTLAVAADDRDYVGAQLPMPMQRTRISAGVIPAMPGAHDLVNGQQIEIVSPDELRTINPAADTLDQADVRSPPLGPSATTSLPAQVLSIRDRRRARWAIGQFFNRWRPVRIS